MHTRHAATPRRFRQQQAARRSSRAAVAAAAAPVMAAAGSKGKALISVSDKTGLDVLAKVRRRRAARADCRLLVGLCMHIRQAWPTHTPSGLPAWMLTCHGLPLLQGLAELGYEIVSTGGSATAIEAAGVPVKRVEELTGFPEMLDGEEGQKRRCAGVEALQADDGATGASDEETNRAVVVGSISPTPWQADVPAPQRGSG